MPVVVPPAAAEEAVIAPSTRVSRRLEIYESNATQLWEDAGLASRIISGAVNVDFARDERRTFDCVLDNSDGLLRHDPFNGLWYDKVVKIYRGVRYNSIDPITGKITQETYEPQLGEFLIDRIDADSFPNQIKITGRDFSKKMTGSKLSKTLQFPEGTPVETVVRAVAANRGITKFMLPATGKVVNFNVVFERGTDSWKVAKQVAESAGFDLFFDATGYLTMRRFLDPTTSPVAYTFQTGARVGNMIRFTKSSNDSRVFNHIYVVGDEQSEIQLDGSQGIIFAEIRNTNPSSPTRIARIGERTYGYESAFFDTQAAAQEFVTARLKLMALEEFNMNLDTLVVPWLEEGTIVQVLDPDRSDYEPTRFLLDTFVIPLMLDPMSVTARRVTIVGDTFGDEVEDGTLIVISDTFTRSVSNGLGTSDSLHDWTNDGGSASDYSVNGTVGIQSLGAVNSSRRNTLAPLMLNTESRAKLKTSVLATGAPIKAGLCSRYTSGDNTYQFQIEFGTGAAISASIIKRVAAVETVLASVVVSGLTHVAANSYWIATETLGDQLSMKIWQDGSEEPFAWHVQVVDTSHANPQKAAIRSILQTGNTNTLPVTVSYDDISIEEL